MIEGSIVCYLHNQGLIGLVYEIVSYKGESPWLVRVMWSHKTPTVELTGHLKCLTPRNKPDKI